MKEASDIRVGNVIKINGAPCKVIAQEVRGTGKGGKTVQLKLKNLFDGAFVEKTYRTEEKAEDIEVRLVKFQYLYKDGDSFVFMNNESFEQFPMPAKAIGKQEVLLKENMEVTALCIDDKPMTLEFPKNVEFKVAHTAPASGGGNFKEAELENGITLLVPQFVKEGDSVRVNTDDFSYLERVTVKSMQSNAVPGKKKEE